MNSAVKPIPRRRRGDRGNASSPRWLLVGQEPWGCRESGSGASGPSQDDGVKAVVCGTDLPISVRPAAVCRFGDSLGDVVRFVLRFLRLTREGKSRAASDLAFDFFEDGFEAEQFRDCDLALKFIDNVQFAGLSDTVLVALLAVTYPARERLKSRAELLIHIHRHLVETNGRNEADYIANSYR